MTGRALLIWLLFVVFAVLNGGLRQKVLIPRLGESIGHVLSTVILCGVILAATWMALPWLRPASSRDAWLIGTLWLALTLAFEFLAGHYSFLTPWAKLLAEYNIARGRIWILVLLATFLAPAVAFRFQRF